MNIINGTLDYYNKNAKKFVTSTISVDFGTVQNRFLDKLHPESEILDYGCGSGRDTKYFLERGYKVTAIDGSQELCKLASEYAGIPVKYMLFQDLNEKEAYDGIWACSSILHVPANELRDHIGFSALHSMAKMAYEWYCYINNIEEYKGEYQEIVNYILGNIEGNFVDIIVERNYYYVIDNLSEIGTNILFQYDDSDGYRYVVIDFWKTIAYRIKICKSPIEKRQICGCHF